ncbi:hypothetical protein VNO78_21444 [Psophocarpus tetragonolobus]|uniref:Uncharacterized protein n=1 Tax=Psophocarpus tetragonolobus TaxID=3891 RepID=A0AAN9XI49_PSOTE
MIKTAEKKRRKERKRERFDESRWIERVEGGDWRGSWTDAAPSKQSVISSIHSLLQHRNSDDIKFVLSELGKAFKFGALESGLPLVKMVSIDKGIYYLGPQ